MAIQIKNKSKVEIGVVPTHLMFVGALAPDESGNYPVQILVIWKSCRYAPALPYFAGKIKQCSGNPFSGTDSKDLDDMFKGLRALKLQVHLIMMVGGANPLNPKDEDAVVEMLNSGLAVAKKYKVKHVSSTSFEEWLSGKKLKGKAFDNAVKQVINVHAFL